MPPTSRSSVLRRAGRAYLGIMAIGIAALAGEVGSRALLKRTVAQAEAFRLKHPHAYDARTLMEAWTDELWAQPWEEYKKSARTIVKVGDQRYTIETNSFGYRTQEFDREKPDRTLRVICIGGSTTVQGRSNDRTYPAVLESLLREKHPSWSVEVLNLGISGIQSEYWPRKDFAFLDFAPDVVVQYEGVNDLLHRHMRRWARAHPYSAAPYRSVLFATLFPFPNTQFDDGFRETLDNITAVTRAAARIGATHVVGTFAAPDISRATPEVRGYLAFNLLEQWSTHKMPLYSYKAYHGLLQHFNDTLTAGVSAGYRVAPIAGRLQAPDRFVDICHMTERGIADLAAAFLPEVEQALSERLRTSESQSR